MSLTAVVLILLSCGGALVPIQTGAADVGRRRAMVRVARWCVWRGAGLMPHRALTFYNETT